MHRKLVSVIRRRTLLAGIPTIGVMIAVGGSPARASAAALPPGCSQSGQIVSCTHTYTLGSNAFTVPAGVSSIHVLAVGGRGGGNEGGDGASVSGDLAVSAGSTLYAVVGGNGGVLRAGAGGGGQGGEFVPCVGNPSLCATQFAAFEGGGGGGASDLRSASDDLSSRLLVAAGGGGAGGTANPSTGSASTGGAGGEAGLPGYSADGQAGFGCCGGGPLSSTGGRGGNCPSPFVAQACTAGMTGGSGEIGFGGAGGAGGGALFLTGSIVLGGGGGGGGGGASGGGGGGGGTTGGGGGGGGGSNLVPAGGSQSVDTTGIPLVTISYKLLPTSKSQCMNGGWQDFPQFKNQGDCVSFIETGK